MLLHGENSSAWKMKGVFATFFALFFPSSIHSLRYVLLHRPLTQAALTGRPALLLLDQCSYYICFSKQKKTREKVLWVCWPYVRACRESMEMEYARMNARTDCVN